MALSERQKAAKARYKARHPERVREQNQRHRREYYARNRERILLNRRLQTYGLTLEELEAMRLAQGGCCATCGKLLVLNAGAADPNSEHIDHCHTTGEVRGLLCSACNRALGIVQDDAERLRRLADYLERTAHARR